MEGAIGNPDPLENLLPSVENDRDEAWYRLPPLFIPVFTEPETCKHEIPVDT